VSLVSIIIPTYNRASQIGETLRSVLAQTHTEREIVVVDDGSTDETAAAVGGFGTEVRYERQANAGVETARNRGAELAQGELLYFLDSDDLLEPQAVERLVALLAMHPEAGMAYGQAEERDEAGAATGLVFRPPYARSAGVWPGTRELEHLLLRSYIRTGAFLVRRSVFTAIGGFRSEFLGMAEDWDLCARMAGAAAVGYVPELIEIVRYLPGGLTSRMDAAHVDLYLRNWERMLRTVLATPEGQAMPAHRRTRAEAYYLYEQAYLAYSIHETAAARERLAEAIAMWPRLLLDPETREARTLWLKLKVPDALMERARARKHRPSS
jgi:glycosyltransferase involved in cell wall biosynthesis